MYSIVKGTSYSTINSSLSTSSLCEDLPRRTTASNERVMGLGTGWNTNTQTYLKLFDYQSTTESSSGGQHIKRRVKSCNLSKEYNKKNKHWATSWHLLDKTEWRGEMEEEEKEESGVISSRLGQREEPPPLTLSPPPPPYLLQGVVWVWLAVISIGLIWIFLTVFWPPSPPAPPLTPSHTLPPPHSHPPFLSHGALVFNWPSI